MPIEVTKEQVRDLLEGGAQLVEVLAEKGYERAHLDGAINLPLYRLDEGTAEQLDRGRPVIVYCFDYQ